jgi:hypothetical protein
LLFPPSITDWRLGCWYQPRLFHRKLGTRHRSPESSRQVRTKTEDFLQKATKITKEEQASLTTSAEAAGHCCWFAPLDIPPGEFYTGQIVQALRESRLVLLFFSAYSNASEQVLREINFAVSQRTAAQVSFRN